ncbi:MAG: DUF1553 domain-containing protein [Pirellulales bacterium]
MRHAGVSLLLALVLAQASPVSADVNYERDVKPIFKRHCFSCHGTLRQKSGLRLDHVSFIRAGGDRGAAMAEASGESLLLAAVRGTGDMERMPLDAKPLSDDEIATLAAWIDDGAKAPDEPLPLDPRKHWSFQKPVRPPLPEVAGGAWSTHPVDRFLAAEHERRGLAPSPPADKNVLVRRVYVDLIGLPPTPAELRAFLADPSDDAYEKVVDRLLASPRYGERWGRHWMDVWRYSDWDGYNQEVRESQPHIWRWRDWIIESLNADKPYEGMITEMLAADEMAPLDESARRATGFLARNWYKFNRNVWLENTVEHTAKAFLGVTLNCARCHDHMYDPILQTEYYQFRAFFEPHQVRTDRVPGESDPAKDGLVRAFDAEADKPTFLFVRGNEASPDKEHPLVAAVPRVLGGDELAIEPVALPPRAYYPGLQTFVQQESLAKAQADVDRAESEMAQANTVLLSARKKLADLVAAKSESKPPKEPAAGGGTTSADKQPADDPAEKGQSVAEEAGLNTAVGEAENGAALAEGSMLAAAANLVAVRAKIAADNAAFAAPAADDAKQLAREASRAERVFNVEQARHNVLRAQQELNEAKKGADEAAKKKITDAEAKLAEAKRARDAAQAALGEATESYAHFGNVYPAASTGRRAALARWIASKNNPLTARVAVNQIWMRHFGSPLVTSVFDFGINGKKPTHPELLDWLAVELMEQGWRMKAIHRLIVTSSAYRMRSSAADASNLALDPENRFLWRTNPRRMEAEAVRDSTLSVADALDVTMGGPDLDPEQGMTVPRRSVYFRSSKEKKMTFLDTFDRANVTDCYRRSETIAPQQALAMVNSALTLAQARRLAGILAKELKELNAGATPDGQRAFVAAAFERVLCRPATLEERTLCLEFLDAQSRRFADPAALEAFTGAENPQKPATDPHERARENLVHVLLNHNDFVTVR